MEKVLKKYGVIVIFYLFIILSVVLVNSRFERLNETEIKSSQIAISNN